MTDQAWQQWRERIAGELAALADREFLVVGEPAAEPEPRRGLFRRRSDPAPTRFVQFLRIGDEVTAECVGATSFGGYVDIAPDDDERLRALGWQAPGGSREPDWGAPNYRIHSRPSDSDRLTGLAVESLEVLGVAPDIVELTRDR